MKTARISFFIAFRAKAGGHFGSHVEKPRVLRKVAHKQGPQQQADGRAEKRHRSDHAAMPEN